MLYFRKLSLAKKFMDKRRVGEYQDFSVANLLSRSANIFRREIP